MPNIPSPISETSEESYFPQSETRRPTATNFSRPRPGRNDSYNRLQRDFSNGTTNGGHTINAFYEPNRDLPDEPRFSLDSEQTTSTSENSAASEFAWDGERGELRSKKRPQNFDQQRVSMESPRRVRGGAPGSSAGSSSRQTSRQPAPPNEMPASSSSSKSSRGGPAISKTVSFDQHSERTRDSQDQHEDTRSHHTVSDSGDSGSFDMEGKWQSSDYDYSSLTEAEIRKIKKKGMNPALYAEMKAAKKGRNKWIGSLSGNTFLS